MTRKPHSPRSARRAPGRRRTRERRRAAGRANPEPDGLEVSNRQVHVRVGAAYVRKVVGAVLGTERVTSARISVALADNATIRRVNRDYLQHDYDTDVLSFLFESTPIDEGGAKRVTSPAALPRGCGRRIDGEILVSAEMAAETAGRFGWSARDELTLYLVHGLLHLCGYDDRTVRERRIMRVRERLILADLGIASPRGVERRPAGRRTPARNGSAS